MKSINLLPKKEAQELTLTLHSKALLKFFVAVAGSMILLAAGAFISTLFIRSSIALNESQIVQLQQKLRSSNNQQLEKEIASLNTQIHNVANIDKQHYYWSKALIELGNLVPPTAHLNFVTFNRSTGQIEVNGVADNRTDVLTFWSNVKKSSYFSNINFPLNNLEVPTDTPFDFTFSINAKAIKQ